MHQPQNDAEVERLVERSAAFRAARAALLAMDAAIASSAIARVFPRQLPARSIGVLLLTASLTHAVLEALVPAATAPAGRYVFAVAGALVGAVLLRIPGRRSEEQEHVRTLR
jgi:uncharacterized membrane protein